MPVRSDPRMSLGCLLEADRLFLERCVQLVELRPVLGRCAAQRCDAHWNNPRKLNHGQPLIAALMKTSQVNGRAERAFSGYTTSRTYDSGDLSRASRIFIEYAFSVEFRFLLCDNNGGIHSSSALFQDLSNSVLGT